MKERELGRTGLRVSEISLGCVELGLEYGAPGSVVPPPAEDDAVGFVRAALDVGVTMLDTARGYGRSEAILGRAIAGRRDDVVLVTKVEAPRERVPDAVEESVSRSLEALQTDYVDVLLLHSAAPEELDDSELLEALARERVRGRVRFIGASTYGDDTTARVLANEAFDVVQLGISPLDRRLLESIEGTQIGVVARSVLLKGALTARAAQLPAELAPLRRAATELDEIAVQAGLTLPALAYRFVLSIPAVATALVGTTSLDELHSIVSAATEGPLPSDLIAAVENVRVEDDRLLDPRFWPAE